MISVLSSIFGALVSAASKAVAAAAEAVPAEVWTHLAAAVVGGAAVAGVALFQGGTSPTESELQPETLPPGRAGFSPLSGLALYERPDSIRIDTVRVPASMPEASQETGGAARRVADALDSTATPSKALKRAALQLTEPDVGPEVGTPSLGYITVPLQGGRPAVDVTEETVTLSGYSPQTGRGLQYEYDVSTPVLEVGPGAWATAPAGELTPGVVVQYRKARLSAGYAPWRPDPLSFRVEISHLFTLL